MKTAIVTSLALALISQTSAFAASCLPNSCTGQISLLDIEANGDAYVGLAGGLTGLTGCTPNQGEEQYFTLSSASANWTLVYNTLLAAQSFGLGVSIAAVPGSTGCTIKYVAMRYGL